MSAVERQLAGARRSAQVLLARHPLIYERLLRVAGRGSLEKRAFLRLLRPGDVVVDVGANAGYFTLLFSDIVGASGEVHAFEPIAPTFERLSRTIADARRFDNVMLNCAACGESSGVATMLVPGADWGQAALAPHATGSWASEAELTAYETTVVSLDAYLEAKSAPRVDFMKLDAEGAELGVLKGAARTLASQRPLLSIELYGEWTRDFGYEPADLVSFLEGLGYDLLIALEEGAMRVTGAEAGEIARSRSLNLVAGRRDAHAARLSALG
jgi:FkbM family methyltransferase